MSPGRFMGDSTSDQPLDAEQISNLMSPSARHQLRHLTILDTIDSTNSELQRLPGTEQHAHAILAESQSKGRGRRARHWYSPPGCNIYLSLGWQFSVGQKGLSTVPLLAAICACRTLSRLGLKGHGIKWPNDVLINGDKTAGILVEMQAVAGGPATAVIGLGMNVNMPPGSHEQEEAEQAIDRRWTDLSSHLKEPGPISRNAVSALLLEELIEGARAYETHGFSYFQKDWASLDLLFGKQVEMRHQDRVTTGIAQGIDSAGGLKLETTGESSAHEYQVFHAGEVRVFYD